MLAVTGTYRIDLHEQRTVRQILLATVAFVIALVLFALEREPLEPEQGRRRPERGRREYQHLRDLN